MSSILEPGQTVFVKDEAEGWLLAKVTSADGLGSDRSAVLQLHSGNQLRIDGQQSAEQFWCLADAASLVGVDDMVKMDALTEGSVLHTLTVRYAAGSIYTSVGSILVAVNPYRHLPDLYAENVMKVYAAEKTNASPAPHPFFLMELAYRGLIADRTSQSILICKCFCNIQ
jgi:myosin V